MDPLSLGQERKGQMKKQKLYFLLTNMLSRIQRLFPVLLGQI